jgi:hypothetical protein
MRLLNTRTLIPEKFLTDIPAYAILSHRKHIFCFISAPIIGASYLHSNRMVPRLKASHWWAEKLHWTKTMYWAGILESITGVPSLVILHLRNVSDYSVAQRMSWAARRMATRAEDQAYSLLGLFEINMPLLYGEGGYRAFRRLQAEIIQQGDDESIFAWGLNIDYQMRQLGYVERDGLLARSPKDFAEAGDIQKTRNIPRSVYTITHKGLDIKGPWYKYTNGPWYKNNVEGLWHKVTTPVANEYYLPLNCDGNWGVCILKCRLNEDGDLRRVSIFAMECCHREDIKARLALVPELRQLYITLPRF